MARRWLLGTAAALALLTLLAAILVVRSMVRAPEPPALALSEGIVAEVISGNQLRLASGERVRLAAIAVAPPSDPLAEQARQAARALAEGQRVRLEPGPDGGSYLYLADGRLLQGLLVEAGYAEVRGDLPADAMIAALLAAQRQAQADGVGRWRLDPTAFAATPPATPFPFACEPGLVAGETIGPMEAARSLGKAVTVVFNAASVVSENGNVTFLSGLDAEQFGVLMPFAIAASIDIPEVRYLNRCLVARGTVERGPSGAPRLVMRAEADLKILR